MSSKKPTLENGYLGAQDEMKEVGLTPLTHKEPEFDISDNELEIKFSVSDPVKVTTNLIKCKTDKDIAPDYVFIQMERGAVSFSCSFPESGFYKFQIFALRKTDDSKSLPNVYNYLIHCKQAINPVYPYPKQYLEFKNNCRLYEPKVLNSSCRLRGVNFKVGVPNANKVAIVSNGEWTQLENTGSDIWEVKCNLDQHRNKNVKVTVNANFVDDETKYSTLLEYKI
ncbi:hypothetical protein LOTGIDRAFT_233820 [Lottia gigantea]|uniref:KY-like immunoglobulin-like domain-containing protein n=1 Tax=Lottia gigantea TaxID=225164 RepID=V4BMU8_LOTGI|nr:hypothetical protein LOTGIDRAFT_233820 [Lottia gigantea]ESO90299.1 hypothetical protein LOTGIDRAFT_233820 [Lottia gigantea]